MTPERWRRVEDLFDAAAAVPEPELHAWLERECAGDTELLQEVTAMLAAGAPTRSIQDQIRGVASQMLRAAEAAATRAIEANSADAAAASSLMLALSHLADVKFETGDTPDAQPLTKGSRCWSQAVVFGP